MFFSEWIETLPDNALLNLSDFRNIPGRFLNKKRTQWKNNYPNLPNQAALKAVIFDIVQAEIKARKLAEMWYPK